MRLYLVLILLAITMAFGTGYYALFIQGNYTVSESDVLAIKKIKTKFRKKTRAKLIINFNSLYSSREHLELIKPITKLNPALNIRSNLYSSDKDCFKDIYNITNSINFEKVVLWEEYRCGKRSKLPRRFFRSPPFIHPSGKSYSLLAYMNGSFPFKNKNWLESHYQFFHLSELKNIKQKIELPFFYKILKQLDEATLQGIFKGKNSLLTDKFYLEKNKDIFVFFDLEYKVYDADEFKQFVLDSPYQVKRYKDGKKCFYKDGNMCWRYSFATMLTFTSKRNIILIIASVGIILLLIYLLYTKLKQQRLEDERRRLALQVLTHEFRTPVASLLLSSDEARRHFVDAPDESQEVLLRLSSDIHRLHRLVEASRNYLNLNDGKNLIKLKLSTVESINSFVQYVLEPYEEEIELKLLDFDKKFVLDEYWISICLKNLVENALNHGEKPVKVILKSSAANELKLIIQDQGKIMDDSLKNLTQEFVKGNKSEGTGLGLNIVNKVIKEMGGELTLKTNPTEFTIILRNKK